MTIKRLDNVGIVIDDLDGAIRFFTALGLEVDGKATVQGQAVDRLVALDDVVSDIVMMRVPGGQGRIELTKFRSPAAAPVAPANAPPNALGIRRIMFAVEQIDEVVARLRLHGGQLVGELVQYEKSWRLAYVRGPKASSSRWRSSSAGERHAQVRHRIAMVAVGCRRSRRPAAGGAARVEWEREPLRQ